jgi:hypothetical protein
MVDTKIDWTFVNFLVCDDIRFEVTAKEILVGVYLDAILVNEVPARMKSLFVRIMVDLHEKEYSKLSLTIFRPSGDRLGRVEGPMSGATPPEGELYRLAFDLTAMGLPDMGQYRVRLGLDDEEADVGVIKVRAPRNDEERARVPI